MTERCSTAYRFSHLKCFIMYTTRALYTYYVIMQSNNIKSTSTHYPVHHGRRGRVLWLCQGRCRSVISAGGCERGE